MSRLIWGSKVPSKPKEGPKQQPLERFFTAQVPAADEVEALPRQQGHQVFGTTTTTDTAVNDEAFVSGDANRIPREGPSGPGAGRCQHSTTTMASAFAAATTGSSSSSSASGRQFANITFMDGEVASAVFNNSPYSRAFVRAWRGHREQNENPLPQKGTDGDGDGTNSGETIGKGDTAKGATSDTVRRVHVDLDTEGFGISMGGDTAIVGEAEVRREFSGVKAKSLAPFVVKSRSSVPLSTSVAAGHTSRFQTPTPIGLPRGTALTSASGMSLGLPSVYSSACSPSVVSAVSASTLLTAAFLGIGVSGNSFGSASAGGIGTRPSPHGLGKTNGNTSTESPVIMSARVNNSERQPPLPRRGPPAQFDSSSTDFDYLLLTPYLPDDISSMASSGDLSSDDGHRCCLQLKDSPNKDEVKERGYINTNQLSHLRDLPQIQLPLTTCRQNPDDDDGDKGLMGTASVRSPGHNSNSTNSSCAAYQPQCPLVAYLPLLLPQHQTSSLRAIRAVFKGCVFYINSCDMDRLVSVYVLEKLIRFMGGATVMGLSTKTVTYVISQHLASNKDQKVKLQPTKVSFGGRGAGRAGIIDGTSFPRHATTPSVLAHRPPPQTVRLLETNALAASSTSKGGASAATSLSHQNKQLAKASKYVHPHFVLACAKMGRRVPSEPFQTMRSGNTVANTPANFASLAPVAVAGATTTAKNKNTGKTDGEQINNNGLSIMTRCGADNDDTSSRRGHPLLNFNGPLVFDSIHDIVPYYEGKRRGGGGEGVVHVGEVRYPSIAEVNTTNTKNTHVNFRNADVDVASGGGKCGNTATSHNNANIVHEKKIAESRRNRVTTVIIPNNDLRCSARRTVLKDEEELSSGLGMKRSREQSASDVSVAGEFRGRIGFRGGISSPNKKRENKVNGDSGTTGNDGSASAASAKLVNIIELSPDEV